jgi:hypothetical protein
VVEGRLKPHRADLAIACFLALITLIANVTHMPYVLFPELGALGWVIFSDQRHPWARSPALLMLTPFLAAVQGLWITRHLAYGSTAVLLNVAITLLLIAALRSPIVPALSAGLLPLALGIHTWSYPFSILIGTGGLALVIALRARRAQGSPPGLEPPEVPRPALWRLRGSVQPLPPLRDWLLPFSVFLLGGLLLVRLIGSPLVLFPPLLVIGFEMIVHRQHCPWRGRYLSVWLVANAAAVVGLALVKCLGVGPAAAFLAVLATLAFLKLARLPFPPALGLALLPFVITDPPLTYPLFTLAGSLWLLVVVAVQEATAGPGGGELAPGAAAGTA